MRHNQFNKLVPFVQIVDDLISKTMHDYSGGQIWKHNTPGLNVADTEKEIVLELAAPGLEKSDFKIQIEDHFLVISVDKKQEATEKKENYTKQEFSFHSFKRMLEIPNNVDTDKIIASYENGILNIKIPKLAEINKNVKTIEIA